MTSTRHGTGVIEWDAPDGSRPDWFFGAGATTAERGLVLVGSLLGLGFVAWQWLAQPPAGWGLLQYVVAAAIAMDLVGGAVSNATGATKRQYFGPYRHSPSAASRIARSPLAFSALHVYPFIIVAVFPGGTWMWAVCLYLGMLAAVLVVHSAVAQYLQRPVAMLVLVAVALASAAIASPPGWSWFAVVYFAKLVLGHAVLEEPYRPAAGR